jgi:O-antigen/teichoic acid export membrane protein
MDLGAVAIRGGAIRVAGYAAGVLVSLAAATLLIRHLGISTFGRYVTVTSLIALVGGVTEAGIYVYGIQEFSARSEPHRGDLMANLLTMRLALTFAGVGCAVGFALAAGYRQVLVLGTMIAGVGLLGQVIADVLSVSLQAQLRLGRLTMVDLIRRVIALLFIGALALLGSGLLPFFATQAVAGAIAGILLAWIVRSSVRIRLSFDLQAWRQLLAETSVYAVATSIGAIYFYVTVIVMSLIASATQTGLFATSFRVVQVALGIPILLLTAIFPLLSHEGAERQPGAGRIVGKVFTVALTCGIWMSLTMALGARSIVDVIAGSNGRGAASVLRIQGVVLTASFISTSSALGLIALRRYRPLIIASSSALGLNIVLGLLLIPGLGAQGGALADVITEVFVAIGLTVVLMRAVPHNGIRPAVAPPIVIASGLSCTVLLLPVGSLARALLATVMYFGALLLMRAIPEEVIEAARRLGTMAGLVRATQRSP